MSSPRDVPSAQQQLLLDIYPQQIPTLDNFVIGENTELLSRLRDLADPAVFDQIYLWGAKGSGRTHLLRGAQSAAQARGRPVCYFEGAQLGTELAPPPGSLVIIDDIETLFPEAQITLFRIFNAARVVGYALLLAGDAAPLQLQEVLREDLRTRIGSTLIFEVKTLDDQTKAQALQQHATERGMRLEAQLIDYLLRHGKRDLPSLLKMLDELDRTSLALKRPPSLPLLREVMQSQLLLTY